jgi:hypothetical protein
MVYLDVGGVPVPEAPGFEALTRDAYGSIEDDDALLSQAVTLFDHFTRSTPKAAEGGWARHGRE